MNKNKIIITVLILTFFVGALQAQTYVQFNSELTPKENTAIKFFEEEIYAVLDTVSTDTVNTAKQYRIIAMNDTITVGKSVSDYYGEITENYNKKNDFIKLNTENNEIYCDVKLLENSNILDGAYIIGENNNRIELENGKLAKSEVGEFFRLVIPNQPTIWYKTSELTEYKSTPLYLTWWFIAIALFSVLIIGAVIGYFITKLFCEKEKLQEVEYDGTNLEDWAKTNHTTIDLLKKHNPTYNDIWEKIQEKRTDWNNVQKELKGKKLNIKTKKTSQDKELTVKKAETQKPPIQDNFVTVTDFNKAVQDIKFKIEDATIDTVAEIKKILPISDDKNKIKELQNTISTKDYEIKKLNNDIAREAKNLTAANSAKSALENQIKETEKTILAVDFLKDYAGKVYDYLNYCQEMVYKSAMKLYNDLQQPDKAGTLLLNFETAVKDLQADKWLQILYEIKERGVIVTSNQEIIRSFAQPRSSEEKLRESKRFLFNELLVKYSSSLLILAEAFRNLNHFGVAISASQKAKFAGFVQKIQTEAGGIELTIKYVPLFENGTSGERVHLIKASDNKISRAYSGIQLKKDDIAEIYSYGIATEFDDTQLTQIKLT